MERELKTKKSRDCSKWLFDSVTPVSFNLLPLAGSFNAASTTIRFSFFVPPNNLVAFPPLKFPTNSHCIPLVYLSQRDPEDPLGRPYVLCVNDGGSISTDTSPVLLAILQNMEMTANITQHTI